jgi:hypothetical protein
MVIKKRMADTGCSVDGLLTGLIDLYTCDGGNSCPTEMQTWLSTRAKLYM